jgi:site-specific recombinase XerD
VVENSHFNRTLRKAAPKLGYHKYIHCHLARHTFATTCITLGISLPSTSKLLGHRNVETTLIYAKFVDTFLDKEMRKFNKLR